MTTPRWTQAGRVLLGGPEACQVRCASAGSWGVGPPCIEAVEVQRGRGELMLQTRHARRTSARRPPNGPLPGWSLGCPRPLDSDRRRPATTTRRTRPPLPLLGSSGASPAKRSMLLKADTFMGWAALRGAVPHSPPGGGHPERVLLLRRHQEVGGQSKGDGCAGNSVGTFQSHYPSSVRHVRLQSSQCSDAILGFLKPRDATAEVVAGGVGVAENRWEEGCVSVSLDAAPPLQVVVLALCSYGITCCPVGRICLGQTGASSLFRPA